MHCLTRFEQFCARKRLQYGERFDASDLQAHFVSAYNQGSDYRIKVVFPSGETKWGHVGVTTGWKPTFLLMRNRNSVSSCDTLGTGCRIVSWRIVEYRPRAA